MSIEAWAIDDDDTRQTLSGMSSVSVLIEHLPDDLTLGGLSRDSLQTDVELRLRIAGIRVPTGQEILSKPGMPFLYVVVNGARTSMTTGKQIGYSGVVKLELMQDVRLVRNPTIQSKAPTWSVSKIVGGAKIDVFQNAVREMTDKFSNAYLAANPKQ